MMMVSAILILKFVKLQLGKMAPKATSYKIKLSETADGSNVASKSGDRKTKTKFYASVKFRLPGKQK